MSINTKKLIVSNFFNESKNLANMLKSKEQLSDLENNWLKSYNLLNDYYEQMNSENYLIIGGYSKEPIGVCTNEDLKEVHKEEIKATFVKISDNEANLFGDSDGEILPIDWEKRKVFNFEELDNI